MATTSKAKDYSAGKEKRGASPSSSFTSHSQSNKEKSNVPNYLRPTISSSHEPLKPLKKNGNEDQQKNLRRRSFDRPPSASPRVQKALISPGRSHDKTAVPGLPREKKTATRSTSFPTKTTSQKAVLDPRTSKTPKASKPQPMPPRGIKKSATTSSPLNKKESNASPSTIASNSNNVTKVVEDDTKNLQEEKESLVHEVEEVIKFENEVQEPNSDIQKSEKEEHVDAVVRETLQVNSGEAEKIKPCDDIPTVPEDENLPPQLPAQIEETEDKSKEVNIVTVQEVKENVDESGDSYNPEETVIEEAKPEVEEKGEQQKATDQESASNEDIRDEKDVEINDQQGGEEESEGIDKEIKEGQEVEGDIGDQKTKLEDAAAAGNVAPKREDQGQGKKEPPSAYNDVIEETASKLLEKRKNKVRALVGAFETVIDYETSASK